MPDDQPQKPQIPVGRKIQIGTKVLGIIFLAITILGISLMAGEASTAAKAPFSGTSITTTIFGIAGYIMSEIAGRNASKMA